jgi:peroxiredoxin
MKNVIRLSLMLFLALGAGMILSTGASAQFSYMENELIGQPAPNFTLNTVSGEKIEMNQYRDGKNAIVFFWATWCPHCRSALKELNAKSEQIEAKGIKLVIVDLGEEKNVVSKYLQKNKIGFNVFLDVESELGETYGLIGVPTFFFVDQKGIVKAVKHSLPEKLESMFAASKNVQTTK